ncbi:MAG: hypothetical protein OXH68_17840 [Gammaproteobacteria bacterium]|nr:hypothetical protein [Gammaproteobacteria bacterium]
MPVRLIDEDAAVDDEHDASWEETALALVRGESKCIEGYVNCRCLA